MNYQQAAAELARSRIGRRRLPGRNTYLMPGRGTEITMRYNQTVVVTWRRCGAVVLNSDGWRTLTTKERMNRVSGVMVYQRRREWFVFIRRTNALLPFTDGVLVRP
jgi:hypothetical protein